MAVPNVELVESRERDEWERYCDEDYSCFDWYDFETDEDPFGYCDRLPVTRALAL